MFVVVGCFNVVFGFFGRVYGGIVLLDSDGCGEFVWEEVNLSVVFNVFW